MAEGMATYSSAKFMENLNLIDFKNYMLQLRKTGGNIGKPGINKFISGGKTWRLDEEIYWETGEAAQVYYMLGAWATAYLIYVHGVAEVTVLKSWYLDIPVIGKSAAFEKHMGLSLSRFDCYLAVAGGLEVEEPAADLGVAVAIVSSFRNLTLHFVFLRNQIIDS